MFAPPLGLGAFGARTVPAFRPPPDLRRGSCRPSRSMVVPLLLLAACVAAVALASKLASDVPWNEVDHRARVLVTPLFALAVVALRPERTRLWAGAVLGWLAACAVCLPHRPGGLPRLRGWTNTPLFSHVALGLMGAV